MLERIKHLFDIEEIVFVLSINSEQLAKAIQGVYGSNFNGAHYLRRFLDMTYTLDEKELGSYIEHIVDLVVHGA